MTLVEIIVLLFFTPFCLLAGAIFATLAMDFIFKFVEFGWLIGNLLWEASSQAVEAVWNWRKK